MKLRLKEAGFEGYTGQFGVHVFQDGLTVDHVSAQDATRISAVMSAEWEDGTPANVGQIYLDSMNNPAPIEAAPVERAEPVKTETPTLKYSREALEAVADEKGINGLRPIGDEFGVKSTSIAGLIQSILKAQGAIPLS
jgi:hypothetical protein